MITRTVAVDTKSELSEITSTRYHLVELAFPAGISYLSEGISTVFDSNVYAADAIEVRPFKWLPTGAQSGSIYLPDTSGSAISLVMNDDVSDVQVTIHVVYLDATDTPTTPIKVVSGIIDDVSITPDGVTLTVITEKSSTEFFPYEYCSVENGFNFLPEDGQIINWGAEKFVLRKA